MHLWEGEELWGETYLEKKTKVFSTSPVNGIKSSPNNRMVKTTAINKLFFMNSSFI